MDGRQFMHHDARGQRGPYTARRAEGPWFAMVPEGLEITPEEWTQISSRRMWDPMPVHLAWASERSLREGLRPGLRGPVGWTPVDAA